MVLLYLTIASIYLRVVLKPGPEAFFCLVDKLITAIAARERVWHFTNNSMAVWKKSIDSYGVIEHQIYRFISYPCYPNRSYVRILQLLTDFCPISYITWNVLVVVLGLGTVLRNGRGDRSVANHKISSSLFSIFPQRSHMVFLYVKEITPFKLRI